MIYTSSEVALKSEVRAVDGTDTNCWRIQSTKPPRSRHLPTSKNMDIARSDDKTLIIDPNILDVVADLPPKNQWTEHIVEYPVIAFIDAAGLDIGYVPAGPRAFFRLSGQFGPQQFIFCWPAGPVTFISVVNTFTTFSVDLSRARGFLKRNLRAVS